MENIEPKPHRGRPTRDARLEAVLAALQAEVENGSSNEAVKRARRQVLRGLRLASWVQVTRASIDEIEKEFRDELFRANPPIM
ncbi:hypothetical protein D9M71_631160 [compost metagenome]